MPHGELLVRFVDACFAGADALAAARDAVASTLGEDHFVDAAAVVANFCMMTRIADSTGTPLDEGTGEFMADFRSELDMDAMVSARLSN